MNSRLHRTLLIALIAAGVFSATHSAWAQSHPSVDRVFPLRGPPGTLVTFLGHGFVPGVAVYLLSSPYPLPIVRRTRTRLVVRIPDGAESGDLMVTIGDQEEGAGPFEVTVVERSESPGGGGQAWVCSSR